MSTSADDILAMVLFAHVVEAQSFTDAAKRAGLSKSAVSARVAALEERLGVRVLNRTTRRLSLTEAGAELYKRAARISAEATEAQQALTGMGEAIRGEVRVNAPVVLGALHLVPAVQAFLEANPAVTVDVTAEDRFVDAMHAGFDVVFRVASSSRMKDSSVAARKIGSDRAVVCAAPGYLSRMGTPKVPDELIGHRCLRYSNHALHEEWRFKSRDKAAFVPVTGPIATNSGVLLREAVLSGAGVGILPSFMVREALDEGALVALLTDCRWPELGIYALTPSRRVPAKVRALIDAFARRLREAGLNP